MTSITAMLQRLKHSASHDATANSLRYAPRMRQAFTLMSLLCLSLHALASATPAFMDGRDYHTLAVQDKIDGRQVVVREFFWYGCPHCYHLEPYLQSWLQTKPADVRFIRTPAPLNAIWESSARGYYAAQQLGIADSTHTALLYAIHHQEKHLFSKSSLTDFYAQFGADKSRFQRLYHSKIVDKKIQRAQDAVVRYRLSGVPAVVVHGKYVVKGSDAKTFKVVDYLIQKVRREDLPTPASKTTHKTTHKTTPKTASKTATAKTASPKAMTAK